MGGLKGRDRLLPRNRWKCVKKLIETMSALEIIEKVSYRHTCAHKNRSPAQYLGIAMHDRRSIIHEDSPIPENFTGNVAMLKTVSHGLDLFTAETVMC
jgi:hypothetical protein